MSNDAGEKIWAKTDMSSSDSVLWLSLKQHLLDTEAISHYIWKYYLPEHTRKILNTALNNHGETILSFLAGSHDVGKCSPAFEQQGYYRSDLMRNLRDNGFIISPNVGKSSDFRHEISGFIAIRDWMTAHSIPRKTAEKLSIIIGGHHGIYHLKTSYSPMGKMLSYGDGKWDTERIAIIDFIADKTGILTVLSDIDAKKITLSIQSLLTACVVMSDWIASSTYLFPLTPTGCAPDDDMRTRVGRAWKLLDLPSPWSYWRDALGIDAMYDRWFGIDAPYEYQHNIVSIANNIGTPSMIILEAPMGAGKTEAALAAAAVIGRHTGAGGVSYALPTQATANGILPRFVQWVANASGGRESFELIHGRAALNEDYNKLRRESLYEDSPVNINTWFDGSKRGILANFSVCTVDQILMAALQAKHFDLRQLGLANKVVIVDEVHACDDYMQVYLNRALEWLAQLGSSVIIMTATLPQSQKKDMVDAYENGLQGKIAHMDYPTLTGYPLITTVSNDGIKVYPQKRVDAHGAVIQVEHIDDDKIIDTIKTSLANGGCACVIRDTVSSAQNTYRSLIDAGFDSSELMLIHSRFNGHDRAEKESAILQLFGKDTTHRPKRFIVVGTQVLEQSLDIDFDVMISDIAPIDSILQRAGRLHRHAHTPRSVNLQAPKLFLTGYHADSNDSIEIDDNILYVYGNGANKNKSKILRAISILQEKNHILTLPDDINSLIQKGYDYTCYQDNPIMRENDRRLQAIINNRRISAKSTLLTSPFPAIRPGEPYNRNGDVLYGSNERKELNSDAELIAKVRDSSSSLSVIVMRAGDDGGLMFASNDMNDRYGMISMNIEPDIKTQKLILSQSVDMPSPLANPSIIDVTISELEKTMIPCWQNTSFLKGELVLLLNENNKKILDIVGKSFKVCYTDELGLIIERKANDRDN